MNIFSRRLSIGALLLLLLNSACNLPVQTPVPAGTILPTGQGSATVPPTNTPSNETPTAVIPVTGTDEVSLQCQFCVNDEPHAVLILSETVSFLVSDPVVGINCITAQVVNGKRILFCRGAQQTTFTFNVCSDGVNCLQYPITLDTCPLSTQAGNPTPVVLTPANIGVTPIATAGASLPAPTQTGVVVSPVPATTAAPPTATLQPPAAPTTAPPAAATITPHPPQSRGTPLPTTRLPRTALSTPEGFLRWYFAAVWNERDYLDLWENYLTPSFKARPNAGGYEGFAAWWSSVQRVDVNSVTVLQNDGTNAWVRVNVTFTMLDGRVISNQEYDYDLFYDAARQTWMFDYRAP